MSGPRRARALSLALVLSALPWVIGAGCDLFATREPVVEESQESLWTPPTSPEIVVRNLELAFESRNFTDYRRALTEDFLFEPDAKDQSQIDIERPGENAFIGWDREVEGLTAENIWDGLDSLHVDLDQFDDDLGQAIRLLKYDYLLTLFSAQGTETYEGEAWLQIVQEANGQWFIFDWEDVASSTQNESWGLLKGRSRL